MRQVEQNWSGTSSAELCHSRWHTYNCCSFFQVVHAFTVYKWCINVPLAFSHSKSKLQCRSFFVPTLCLWSLGRVTLHLGPAVIRRWNCSGGSLWLCAAVRQSGATADLAVCRAQEMASAVRIEDIEGCHITSSLYYQYITNIYIYISKITFLVWPTFPLSFGCCVGHVCHFRFLVAYMPRSLRLDRLPGDFLGPPPWTCP